MHKIYSFLSCIVRYMPLRLLFGYYWGGDRQDVEPCPFLLVNPFPSFPKLRALKTSEWCVCSFQLFWNMHLLLFTTLKQPVCLLFAHPQPPTSWEARNSIKIEFLLLN